MANFRNYNQGGNRIGGNRSQGGQRHETSQEVKSVYNFVPAPNEEEVFYPTWADQVSHDIPFADGESGEIEVTIKAETPVYIRNGHSKEDKEIYEKWKERKHEKGFVLNESEDAALNRYLSFSNFDKKYFIPATSIKGMLRNVMEILSFGKLNPKLVDDNRFAYRDLTRGSLYMENYSKFIKNIKAGWLVKNSKDEWEIEECNFKHIHHDEIDKINSSVQFKTTFSKNQDDKSASFKYHLWNSYPLISKFNNGPTDFNRYTVVFDNSGYEGTLVFTGQSSKRDEQFKKGKKYEFVFIDKNQKGKNLIISQRLKDDFLFIYKNDDRSNISKDWKFWRNKMENGNKVPIFFLANGNEVLHFGLAYMYRLPYQNSTHQLLPIKGYSNKIDLTECIFGNIKKDHEIKGRLFISHGITENPKIMDIKSELLSSPKASFTPFYINQTNGRKNTYEDSNAKLSGYKRFPVHNYGENFNEKQKGAYTNEQKTNKSVFSHFIPLDKTTEFTFKIRFHNLKKVEIGAILSSITFHNQKSKYHSLGGIKPYGYGKVSLIVTNIKTSNNKREELQERINYYINIFENEITENLKIKNPNFKYLNSQSIKEILIMASNPQTDRVQELLKYPTMDQAMRINDFNSIKKEGKFLKQYSQLNK